MTSVETLRAAIRHAARSATTPDKTNHDARLAAAGLGPDTPDPEAADAFRLQLARRIYMFVNGWDGCREGLCQRHRGCMAPSGICVNLPPLPPDPEGREWAELAPRLLRVIKARLAEAGEGET